MALMYVGMNLIRAVQISMQQIVLSTADLRVFLGVPEKLAGKMLLSPK